MVVRGSVKGGSTEVLLIPSSDANSIDDYTRSSDANSIGHDTRSSDANSVEDDGLTPLHAAVIIGDEETVRTLLACGNDAINVPCKGKVTPLHSAAKAGFLNILEILLEEKAEVGATNVDGETPFFSAISARQVNVVEMFLEFGVDPNSKGPFKKSALHYAVDEASEEIVTVLLNYGADVNSKDSSGHTALIAAIFNATSHRSESDDLEDRDLAAEKRTAAVVNALLRHVIKLDTAGFFVSEENLRALDSSKDEELFRFHEKCLEEVERMKSLNLYHKFTLYNFLVSKRRPRIVKDEKVAFMIAYVSAKVFPEYECLLIDQLKGKGKHRCLECRSSARQDLSCSQWKCLSWFRVVTFLVLFTFVVYYWVTTIFQVVHPGLRRIVNEAEE